MKMLNKRDNTIMFLSFFSFFYHSFCYSFIPTLMIDCYIHEWLQFEGHFIPILFNIYSFQFNDLTWPNILLHLHLTTTTTTNSNSIHYSFLFILIISNNYFAIIWYNFKWVNIYIYLNKQIISTEYYVKSMKKHSKL